MQNLLTYITINDIYYVCITNKSKFKPYKIKKKKKRKRQSQKKSSESTYQTKYLIGKHSNSSIKFNQNKKETT